MSRENLISEINELSNGQSNKNRTIVIDGDSISSNGNVVDIIDLLKLDAATEMLVMDIRPGAKMSMDMSLAEYSDALRDANKDSEAAKKLRERFNNASFIQSVSLEAAMTYLRLRGMEPYKKLDVEY